MTLSVLTLVKNRETHFANLVEGLNRSSLAVYELVVIDMGDTPMARPDTRMATTVVRLDSGGLPLAKARNLAAHHASGDALVFLDVDCIPGRMLVADMWEALRANDALICAGVGYVGAADVGEDWCEHDLANRARNHPVRDFTHRGLRRETNPGLFWSLAFGVRKATFHGLQGFDEEFTGYGAEDTDFGFRASEAGIPLLFMGGKYAYHQHHAVFHPPLQHFDDIIRNAQRFHRKWNVWPMDGWLNDFEHLGLISRTPSSLILRRAPTPNEVEAARQVDLHF